MSVPGFFVDIKGTISEKENRTLAIFPNVIVDRRLNTSFATEFESYVNDRIGFRDYMINLNSYILYHGFYEFESSTNMLIGINDEVYYASANMIEDYHHLNLLSEEKLTEITNAYQMVADWLKDKGIQYYRLQCWDKQTIYKENFSPYCFQYGNRSRTEQIVDALDRNTDICQIDIKPTLMNAKDKYRVYPRWGDTSHWSKRGAYLAYLKIMETINAYNNDKYYVIDESDLNINVRDMGLDYVGWIHNEDYLEDISIRHPQGIRDDKRLTLQYENGSMYFVNNNVDNEDCIVVIGDSYSNGFLLEYFVESFHEVVYYHVYQTDRIPEIIEAYKPCIVFNENVERMDVFARMVTLSDIIREE